MPIAARLRYITTTALAAFALLLPASAQQQGGEVTLYDGVNFTGHALPVNGPIASMSGVRFNDQVMSMRVASGTWEICKDGNFRGTCETVSRDISDLRSIGMGNKISSIRPAAPRPVVNEQAPIVLYSRANFSGEARAFDRTVNRISQVDFNDKARSVRVNSGVWQICSDGNGGGRCEYVDSSIRNLRDLGLDRKISSVIRTNYQKGPNGHAISLFNYSDYRGEFLGFDAAISELGSRRFSDTAGSIRINRGKWLVCSDANYRGHCEVLGRSVRDLNEFELDNKISSLRPYDGRVDDRVGDRHYGNDHDYGDRNSGNDRNRTNDRGYEGEASVFFPRPEDYGRRIRYRSGAANAFCRDRGFREAVYADRRSGYLSDVLCRR